MRHTVLIFLLFMFSVMTLRAFYLSEPYNILFAGLGIVSIILVVSMIIMKMLISKLK